MTNERTASQKILHFPLVKLIIGTVVVVGIYIASQFLFGWLFSLAPIASEQRGLAISVLCSLVAITTYIMLFRVYEKRQITELSGTRFGRHLVTGILLGAVLQALTILVIYLQGGYTVSGINSLAFILPGLTMAFSTAIFEEILMRGIIFRLIEEKLGSYLALLISALIFGALHLGNPNSSLLLALGLAIQAGLLLGVAYIYAKNLWFPIAIHFAWNFAQSGIFGAAVSGHATGKALFASEMHGEDWYTGGEFGPEGSIQATIFCLIAAAVLLILCIRQGKIIKPFWLEKKT
ncbi:MAG: type II CAAX endopeptidase family protein [Bacteroidota bacterium]